MRLITLLALAALGSAAPAVGQDAWEPVDEDAPVVADSRLAGLAEAAVRAEIGDPALSRTEGAGALWTYRLPQCVLFVYFADEGRGLRVTGVSPGPRRHGEPAPELTACLAQAAANRVAPAASQPPVSAVP